MDEQDTMTINGVEYVRRDRIPVSPRMAEADGLEYCIVRTYSAGVFAGWLKERHGKEVTIIHARRLWYWKGAASLSELAVRGVACPDECKFPCAVPEVKLMEAIEIIPCTDVARECIKEVPEWTAQ